MLFKPCDEMSLRHLFSSSLGESTLNMSYLGPALNVSNNIDTSPDCIILDKREIQWKVLRGEFKYSPQSSVDFINNGTFDIAIVWQLSGGITREKLQAELFKQNRCTEVFVVSEQTAFNSLPNWTWKLSQASSNIVELTSVETKLKRIFKYSRSMRYSTLVVAYTAVKIYPAAFDFTKMLEELNKKFPDVHNMADKGRAVVISKLRQTKPKLIVQERGNRYKWNNELNPEGSLVELTRIIIEVYDKEIPSTEFINSVRAGVD